VRDELDTLMVNLAGADRDRLTAAFAADPELADGLSTMLANLPAATQARILARLAAHLGRTPLGSGAVQSALGDVVEDTTSRRPVSATRERRVALRTLSTPAGAEAHTSRSSSSFGEYPPRVAGEVDE
jgi:hypothetical protein